MPGPEHWADGRLFFEWLDGEGGVVGVTRVHSARGDDASGMQDLVVSSPVAGAVPVLRFQNLGESGGYEVDFLMVTPVRERAVWSVGKWLLGFGFLAVLAGWCPGTKKPARWRGWVAAGIWMVVATGYAFPGPWEVARPFAVPFAVAGAEMLEVGEVRSVAEDLAAMPDVTDHEPMVEQLPTPNDLGLRLKIWLPWLRPVLHLALLSVPVFAMAWFVGWWRAMWLGLLLSVSIEAAQVMYGFGFGWDDVMDLIVNAVGIFAAIWVFRRYARRIHSWMPFPFPEPVEESVADRLDEKWQAAGAVE